MVLDKSKEREVERKAKLTQCNQPTENHLVQRCAARLEAIMELCQQDRPTAIATLIQTFYLKAHYQPTWRSDLEKMGFKDLADELQKLLPEGKKRGRVPKAVVEAPPVVVPGPASTP